MPRTTASRTDSSRALVAGAVAGLLLAGCGAQARTGREEPAAPDAAAPTASGAPTSAAPSTPPTTPVAPSSPSTPGPAVVAANEVGQVPVLMYHQVLRRPKGVYDITPRAFRAELERLAREGYVPVTAADYAAGRIDLPAGAHPVVLSFDDSTTTQLALDRAGRPVAGTAVAILLDVAARHPGFTPTATFFVNRDPFAEPGGRRTLGWLRENGFEVGNHALDHVSLGSLRAERVRRQLAGGSALVRRATGTPPATLALPFGVRPDDRDLMMSGSWRGTAYAFDGAFLVGAGPAPSPHSRGFDPAGIPRIRSQGRRGPDARYGSAAWLDRLAARPGDRYTSDGDPTTVARPSS